MMICAAIFYGCSNDIIDELDKANQTLEEKIDENKNRIAALEKQCSELNSNIAAISEAISALQSNDFVKSISPVYDTDGITIIEYVISFVKSGDVHVYMGKNGKNGHSPSVGIAKDADGLYYWTVDGEWMKDSTGSRIKAAGENGITPQLRITDGNWEISYDGGQSWSSLGAATGKEGMGFFSDVSWSDDYINLTLVDGTVLTLPRYKSPVLELSIEDNETGAESGIDVYIGYSISEACESTTITASSDGNYAVRIEKENSTTGKLRITPPTPYCDGFVNIVLTDDAGFSQVNVINFHQNVISFSDGLEYQIPSEGGTVDIPFIVNFDYEAYCDSDWLTLSGDTRADMNDKTITVTATKNELFCNRQATIKIFAKTNSIQPYAEIIINQASAYFSVSQSKFAVPYVGGEVTAEIWSSLGLNYTVGDSADWLKVSVTDLGSQSYRVTATASRNASDARRYAEVILYDENYTKELGHLEIVQLSEFSTSTEDMVFTVRANVANDFSSTLPLRGAVDCYVDWGDGSVEYYTSELPSHIYDVTEPQSFTVTISGTVTSLNSSDVPAPSIVEVTQWGNTGLEEMSSAFHNNTLLRYIAGDTAGSFASVTDFNEAFSNCISLKEIPENLFSFCTNALNFNYAFCSCHSLTSLPGNLFSSCPNVTSFARTFYHCINLESIPEELFSACTQISDLSGCFLTCQSLVSIPESLFNNCRKLNSITEIFGECSKLESIPHNLFDNNRNIRAIGRAFTDCHSLRGESPYTIINGEKYHLYERNDAPDYFSSITEMTSLFGGCWENLDDKGLIPDICK